MSFQTTIQVNKICRTCLSEEGDMRSVYGADESSGEPTKLHEMLMCCASVQVFKKYTIGFSNCNTRAVTGGRRGRSAHSGVPAVRALHHESVFVQAAVREIRYHPQADTRTSGPDVHRAQAVQPKFRRRNRRMCRKTRRRSRHGKRRYSR